MIKNDENFFRLKENGGRRGATNPFFSKNDISYSRILLKLNPRQPHASQRTQMAIF